MLTPEQVAGSEAVIEALGYWPEFHDAEVISFSVERALPLRLGLTHARLAVHVRGYEAVGEGTPNYELVLRKSLLLRILFNGACALELSGFNSQNVIDSISVSPVATDDQASLLVEVESIWGFGGSFRCASIELEAVDELPL